MKFWQRLKCVFADKHDYEHSEKLGNGETSNIVRCKECNHMAIEVKWPTGTEVYSAEAIARVIEHMPTFARFLQTGDFGLDIPKKEQSQ